MARGLRIPDQGCGIASGYHRGPPVAFFVLPEYGPEAGGCGDHGKSKGSRPHIPHGEPIPGRRLSECRQDRRCLKTVGSLVGPVSEYAGGFGDKRLVFRNKGGLEKGGGNI